MTSIEPQDGVPTPRRYWSMLAIALTIGLAVIDGAIANVALPTIARDLHTAPAGSIWVVNAYQLAIVTTLLPLAALGDSLGYRRVYLVGIAVFTAGSLGCALADSLEGLAVARILQGLGAAGLMSTNGALVRFTYPARLLGRGIGFNALVVAAAGALGPTLAAAILAQASWRWLFAINLPFGLAAIAVGAFALPRTQGSGRRFDLASAALNALAFGLIILGVETLGRREISAGIIETGVGVAAAILLVRREMGVVAPLVPLDLLRIRIFRLSVITAIAAWCASTLAFVVLPFHFEADLGRSAVQTGLLMTPWPVGVGLAAAAASPLVERWPAGVLGALGLAVMALGLALIALLPGGASDLDIAWRMGLCGMGFGLFQAPNNRTLIAAAPRERSGAAGGMLGVSRLTGQSLGALAIAVSFRLGGVGVSGAMIGLAAALAVVAALVSLTRLGANPVASDRI